MRKAVLKREQTQNSSVLVFILLERFFLLLSTCEPMADREKIYSSEYLRGQRCFRCRL